MPGRDLEFQVSVGSRPVYSFVCFLQVYRCGFVTLGLRTQSEWPFEVQSLDGLFNLGNRGRSQLTALRLFWFCLDTGFAPRRVKTGLTGSRGSLVSCCTDMGLAEDTGKTR